MISLYDKVKIKSNGIKGEVIDISVINGEKTYIIESDDKDALGGYGKEGNYKLFWCKEQDMELSDEHEVDKS